MIKRFKSTSGITYWSLLGLIGWTTANGRIRKLRCIRRGKE